MDTNHVDYQKMFPELQNPEETLMRIGDTFVAAEYATAAFGLIREIVARFGDAARLGQATVITAPHDYDSLVTTIGKWWFFNFHMADAEALEEGDDVEEFVPGDYEHILDEDVVEEDEDDDSDKDEDDDEEELVEGTFYQVGTFLLDSTVIPHDTIFEREDLDCYAYDYPEERVEAERFYWARMVWEPNDFKNEDFRNAIFSAAEFVLDTHGDEVPFAEHHNGDFEQLIINEELCNRVLAAVDFGVVITIEGGEGAGEE